MKLLTALAVAALALNTAACAALNPLAVDPKTTAAAQKMQAQSKAAFDAALAARLEHCRITGQTGGGIGGLAGSATGLSATFSFECPARPWDILPPLTVGPN
jgi:outer membrane lipoprotein SlyB